MVKRVYELEAPSGEVYELRLNSFQLAGYLKSNFDGPTAPIVGVLQAIDRLDLLLDLLNRALRGAGNAKISGAELYDQLVDDGWSTPNFSALVVHIAVVSGIIAPDMEAEYLSAVTDGENGALGVARTVLDALKGKQQDEGAEAEAETAGPTS